MDEDEGVRVEGIAPEKRKRPFGAKTKARRTLADNLSTLPKVTREKVRMGKYGSNNQLLIQHLSGKTVAELAAQYDLTVGKTHQLLTQQQRNIYVAVGRDNVLTRLTAKALAALEANLNAGDKEVAIKVLTDVGILKPDVKGGFPALAEGEESFEFWRAKVTRKSLGDVVGAKAGHTIVEDDGPVITAEFVEEKGTRHRAPREIRELSNGESSREGHGDAGVDGGRSAGDQHPNGEGGGDGGVSGDLSRGAETAADHPRLLDDRGAIDVAAGQDLHAVGDDQDQWVK